MLRQFGSEREVINERGCQDCLPREAICEYPDRARIDGRI